jgi:hypothetical protein
MKFFYLLNNHPKNRHPPANKLKSDLNIILTLPKEVQVDLHMQIFIGYEDSTQFHVIEQTRVLPAFSMFAKVELNEVEEPRGFVTFTINERTQRVSFFNFCFSQKIN